MGTRDGRSWSVQSEKRPPNAPDLGSRHCRSVSTTIAGAFLCRPSLPAPSSALKTASNRICWSVRASPELREPDNLRTFVSSPQLAYEILDARADGAILVSPMGLQKGAAKIADVENILSVELNENSTPTDFVLKFLNKLYLGISMTAKATVRAAPRMLRACAA